MTILFVFAGLPILILGAWAIYLAKKPSTRVSTLLWWLVPAYPIMYFVAQSIPKDEACGIAGFCVGAFYGFFAGIAWLVIFPIISIFYFSIKNRQQENVGTQTPSVGPVNSKKRFFFWASVVILILCAIAGTMIAKIFLG